MVSVSPFLVSHDIPLDIPSENEAIPVDGNPDKI